MLVLVYLSWSNLNYFHRDEHDQWELCRVFERFHWSTSNGRWWWWHWRHFHPMYDKEFDSCNKYDVGETSLTSVGQPAEGKRFYQWRKNGILEHLKCNAIKIFQNAIFCHFWVEQAFFSSLINNQYINQLWFDNSRWAWRECMDSDSWDNMCR